MGNSKDTEFLTVMFALPTIGMIMLAAMWEAVTEKFLQVITWLLNHGFLVPSDEAVLRINETAGFSVFSLIITVVLVILTLWLIGYLVKAALVSRLKTERR